MFGRLAEILSMIRFSHTLFALPFALLAGVMAYVAPQPADGPTLRFTHWDWLGVLLCMVFARSTAMAFNRLVDRELDAANPRTAGRHLPAGTLTVSAVSRFVGVNAVAFVAATLLFWPNFWPLLLAVPVLAVLCGYSYAKRFTAAAHYWLGGALMLAPICTWIALRGELLTRHPADLLPAIWLGGAVLCWVAGFDVIYACQDAEYDRSARLHSIPAAIGIRPALRWAAFSHLCMVAFLVTLPAVSHWGGPTLPLGWIYWAGVTAVALLLLYEHWLVKEDDLTRVNVAFFQVNAVVSLGLFLITSLDLLL